MSENKHQQLSVRHRVELEGILTSCYGVEAKNNRSESPGCSAGSQPELGVLESGSRRAPVHTAGSDWFVYMKNK